MKRYMLAATVAIMVLLSACGSQEPAIVNEQDIQNEVTRFQEQFAAIEADEKSALAAFNDALAGYSSGEIGDDELADALKGFKDAASDKVKRAEKVKVAKGLPEEVRSALEEAQSSFVNAYLLKEEAALKSDSPDVTREQFEQLNQTAELAMLLGVARLGEVKTNVGIAPDTDEDETAGDGVAGDTGETGQSGDTEQSGK